jgi:hypothetical protein
MTEAGKVFKGQKFIADVQYEHQMSWEYDRGTPTVQNVYLQIIPPTAVSPYFSTADMLTLHMSDGKKQHFYVESSDGLCRATGGPH